MSEGKEVPSQGVQQEWKYEFHASLTDDSAGIVGKTVVLVDKSRNNQTSVYRQAPNGTIVATFDVDKRFIKGSDFSSCEVAGTITLRPIVEEVLLEGCIEVTVSVLGDKEDYVIVIGDELFKRAAGGNGGELDARQKLDLAKMYAVKKIVHHVDTYHYMQIMISRLVLGVRHHLTAFGDEYFRITPVEMFYSLEHLLGDVLDRGYDRIKGAATNPFNKADSMEQRIEEVLNDISETVHSDYSAAYKWKNLSKLREWIYPSTEEINVARAVALKYGIDLMNVGNDKLANSSFRPAYATDSRFASLLIEAFSCGRVDPSKYLPRNYVQWFRRKVNNEYDISRGCWDLLNLSDLYKTLWFIIHDHSGDSMKECPDTYAQAIGRIMKSFPGMLRFTHNGFSQTTKLISKIVWHLMDFDNEPFIDKHAQALNKVLLDALAGNDMHEGLTSLPAGIVVEVCGEAVPTERKIIDYVDIKFNTSVPDAHLSLMSMLSLLRGNHPTLTASANHLFNIWNKGEVFSLRFIPGVIGRRINSTSTGNYYLEDGAGIGVFIDIVHEVYMWDNAVITDFPKLPDKYLVFKDVSVSGVENVNAFFYVEFV